MGIVLRWVYQITEKGTEMVKTHFGVKVAFSTEVVASCGRGKRLTDNTFNVDCGLCQNRDAFILAHDEAKSRREAAFWAQEPRTVVPQFGRVNDDGVMECPDCSGVLWRERPRSLFSYHYVCANAECGKAVFPMTETGMCT
jgi:hypothetical protein